MTIWSGADLICMERRPALVLANVQVPGGRRADIAIRDRRVVHTGTGVQPTR